MSTQRHKHRRRSNPRNARQRGYAASCNTRTHADLFHGGAVESVAAAAVPALAIVSGGREDLAVLDRECAIARGHLAAAASAGSLGALPLPLLFVLVMTSSCCLFWRGLVGWRDTSTLQTGKRVEDPTVLRLQVPDRTAGSTHPRKWKGVLVPK